MIATLPSKELPPTVKGNARTKSSKAQTKPKRTVIGGGINKRLKPKLPNAAQDIPKAGRQPLTNPTAVHGSGAVGHNATEKRVHDPSHINPRSGTQIYTGPNKNSVPGGLAAALMSFSQRTTTVTSDRATVSKEQTGSVTVPSPAPASDVGRKDLETESAQPPRESLPADGDYQQRSIPGANLFNFLEMLLPDAELKGTALSPAPDGASDLFSRLEQPLCEIPLTSPQDEDIRDPTVPAVPLSLSPMRPSVKRRSSPGPGDEQPRKKGKDDSDTNDVFTVESRQVRVHVQASSKPTVSLRSKTLQPSRPKPANVPASRSVTATHSNAAQGLPKVQGSTNTASTSTWGHPTKATADARLNARPRHLTASGSTRSIHDQNLVGGEGLLAGNTLEPRRLPQLAPGSGAPAVLRTRPAAGRKPLIEKPIHPAPKQEKPPFEFTFSMEKRSEGGKAEENRATKGLDEYKRALKADGLLPIPDYKRMHSAQEAALTARRGQIVPVVPLPLELHTDVRAHEREQFEDGLRERRREAERVAEEKRRVREVEEEREVRELRRRAVPKAHEVPEWYAHAPKRAARLDESEDVGV
ncbi:hypothetical protein EUX98_g8723 [Antrodiella citrinella]|uniref:TPX2 C-terminal domain-containing protein n=1 Tax=Antrodiella citrinella TaxID=2447956 RepID=A0A4S4M3N2_9APHY|nr:hypothetical protein EUX98_g8723 [Antrodiella citrinella]